MVKLAGSFLQKEQSTLLPLSVNGFKKKLFQKRYDRLNFIWHKEIFPWFFFAYRKTCSPGFYGRNHLCCKKTKRTLVFFLISVPTYNIFNTTFAKTRIKSGHFCPEAGVKDYFSCFSWAPSRLQPVSVQWEVNRLFGNGLQPNLLSGAWSAGEIHWSR